MSFLKRLFGRPTVESEPRSGSQVEVADVVFRGAIAPDLVEISGAMTVAKSAMKSLVERRDPADTGYLEVSAVIQREPDNPVDANSVAVLVEGERVGYLPGYLGKVLNLPADAARAVQVQIFTQLLEKGLRVEAWAWLGTGVPQWHWTEAKRPPMSSSAKRAAKHAGTENMVKKALAGGGERAESFKAGSVDGVHYLQTVEPIKQLKREGRLEEALVLCYKAIEGAESAARREGMSPAPFYTEQAAIVHRKLGQRDEEIAVLRRYIAACPPDRRMGSLATRLDKLLA